MKTKRLIYAVFILISCNSKNDDSVKKIEEVPIKENRTQLDSVKWLFYAYNFNGKGLFEKNRKITKFNPIECEVKIISEKSMGDSVYYEIDLYKEGYEYKYIYEGFTSYGFYYLKGVFIPETGMLKTDYFSKLYLARKDNIIRDSMFRSFLREADTSKVSEWLKNEGKRRKVF